MSRARTYLALTVAAFLWGANFNLAGPVLAEMPALAAGAWRHLIAASVALIVVLIRRERLQVRHLGSYALLSLFGVFGYNVLFFLALRSTTAVNASLIMALSPLLTVIVAYFVLGDRPTVRQLVAIPLGIAGVTIVVLGPRTHAHISIGDALMLAASLMWALYSVSVRRLMPEDASSTENIAGIMTVGAVALTSLALASAPGMPWPGTRTWALLTALALGGGLLAYYLWNAGVHAIGAGAAAPFINLVPVSSLLIAAFTGNAPTAYQMLGGAVVLVAVSISSWQPNNLRHARGREIARGHEPAHRLVRHPPAASPTHGKRRRPRA